MVPTNATRSPAEHGTGINPASYNPLHSGAESELSGSLPSHGTLLFMLTELNIICGSERSPTPAAVSLLSSYANAEPNASDYEQISSVTSRDDSLVEPINIHWSM